MADTHEIDDGFHEVHLSGKQLVFLFMATTVVAVVIFLCGVQVGRGVRAQQLEEPLEDPAAGVRTPLAEAPIADTGPPAAEPPAPPAETEELSYKRRLEGTDTAESLRTRSPEPLARPAAAPARTPAPPPVPAADVPDAQTIVGTPQPGLFVVQVLALRDRSAAAGIVQRLAGKGYPAFLVAGGAPSGLYRVQVGRFRDRGEAERVVERLKEEGQFTPWIIR